MTTAGERVMVVMAHPDDPETTTSSFPAEGGRPAYNGGHPVPRRPS